MLFKDKVIWITGASSGIGAELAYQLAELGAWLVLTARNEEALHGIAKHCLQHTTHCIVLPADLADSSQAAAVAKSAIELFGRIDVLILNAGVTQRSLATQTEMEVYRRLMEINFFAPVGITKQILPKLAEQNASNIVVVSSMAGLMGFPMRTGYAAAKHALKGFFETLQSEHTIPTLTITIVSPGRINTPISFSALTANGAKHNQMDDGQLNGIPVKECADRIIKAIIKKKQHVIIAREERLLYWIWWLIPALYRKIARQKGMQT